MLPTNTSCKNSLCISLRHGSYKGVRKQADKKQFNRHAQWEFGDFQEILSNGAPVAFWLQHCIV